MQIGNSHEEEIKGKPPEYFESIVETVREPLVVLDAALCVRTANRSFYQTFHVSKAETVDRSMFELGNGQWDIPVLRRLLGEILPARMELRDLEVEHVFPSIGRRAMLLNARRIDGARGRDQMILLAIEDVTDRKRAEEKMRLYASKLERSNRALQDFAQVASHDLQEPLRKIEAFGDRLKARAGPSLDAESRDYLGRMLNASARMRALINDLLTFSRLETKAQPFVPTDLEAVAREVISDLEARIEQTRGQVSTHNLPTIDVDPVQIRQLLQNLIGNALKYHRKDVPPVVHVHGEILKERRHAAHNPGGSTDQICQIFVRDNGIGFDEKYLDRIFTVFQRLHGRGEYDGTGVGLAVCRKIAELHGGAITAHSRPGEGSTFVVSLPVKQSVESEEP